jgi:hypothetical protein
MPLIACLCPATIREFLGKRAFIYAGSEQFSCEPFDLGLGCDVLGYRFFKNCNQRSLPMS